MTMDRRLFRLALAAASVTIAAAAALAPSGGAADVVVGGALVHGPNSLMRRKAHGSTEHPPMTNLRWGSDYGTVRRPRAFPDCLRVGRVRRTARTS